MGLRKVIIQSRKLPAQHIETLWENIYKYNVKMETLMSILAFYLHHRVYPPPVQRAFDTLLLAFTDPKVPKKLRVLLFQTVEEMCHWLSPSCITETTRLSTSPGVVAELLPCFLINKDIPPPDHAVYERLISALTSPGLSQEDRSKILGFLMNTLPSDMQPVLNKQLIAWLSYSRTSQTTGSIFRSADVTEVDGSPGMGICTALSLVSMVTDLHMLSVVTFSNIRRYLYRSRDCPDGNLINAVFTYCSALLTQASKKPTNHQDKQLLLSVLEEILLIMKAIKEVDNSCSGRCHLIVRSVQHLAEQLKLTALLLSVWEYHLLEGGESALTQKILNNVVKSEFSQGPVSQRISMIAMTYGAQLGDRLAVYSSNLLKLAATHPSSLVEEFLEIVPHFGSNRELIIEVLHCLLDLPILSATICVSQTNLLAQAGFRVPTLFSVKQLVEAEHKPVYSHMMRCHLKSGQTEDFLKLYPGYWSALRPILSLGVVEVCCQITPLLLEKFLDSVSSCQEANSLLLPVLLSRVSLLCPLPSYQKSIFEVLPRYISNLCTIQPQLMECSCVMQFVSVTNHTQLCPQLFDAIVSALGVNVKTEEIVASSFETLDAVLREMLLDKNTRDLKLEISISTSLAKLASRNIKFIPRAITALEKLCQCLQSSAQEHNEEERELALQNVKNLIRILKNPRVANVMLSPSSKEDIAMAALMRVLFQFLE